MYSNDSDFAHLSAGYSSPIDAPQLGIMNEESRRVSHLETISLSELGAIIGGNVDWGQTLGAAAGGLLGDVVGGPPGAAIGAVVGTAAGDWLEHHPAKIGPHVGRPRPVTGGH